MGFYEDRIFPWILDKTDTRALKKRRALTVAEAQGEVLEIGLGTGLTLAHYPPAVKTITAVEPSGGAHPRALRRAAEAGRTLDLTQLAGEKLPFDDGRFDTVVITLVLCTADDVAAVLEETYRVLRPGGRYYFLEHVASDEPKARRWQERLNGVSKVVGCGCQLIRDTERALRESPFDVEIIERKVWPGFEALYPMIRGVAVKPA